MREIELIQAIKKRCSEALINLRFNTEQKNKPKRCPKTIRGWNLPAGGNAFVESDNDVEKQNPFIIVRPQTGNDSARDELKASMLIIVQVYNDESDFTGYEDLLICMNRIYDSIKNNPVLENTFIYNEGSFQWSLNEEQPFPIWQMGITTDWTLPNTQRSDVNTYI